MLDAILTYKYSILLIKKLRENNASIDLFESIVLKYREILSSLCSSVFLDITLTQYCNEEHTSLNNIDTYGVLAIEHYLKFIEVFKHPSEDFKECGKKLLKRLVCIISADYELPSWIYN